MAGWLVCGLPINIGYLLIMPPNTRRGPEIIFIIFSLQFSSLYVALMVLALLMEALLVTESKEF